MVNKIVIFLCIFVFFAGTISSVQAGTKGNQSWSKIKDIFK
jgi:hypothetical protein